MDKNYNHHLAVLLDDYASKVSELTAITQYLHHHLVVAEQDVAELLKRIAIQEMHHLEMVGETLIGAGIDPRYYDQQKKYWVGNFVDYQYNVGDILCSDIMGELQAIFQYYQHLQVIHNQQVRTMIENIIRDEMMHIRWLMEKLAKYCPQMNPHHWLANQVQGLNVDPNLKSQLSTILNI